MARPEEKHRAKRMPFKDTMSLSTCSDRWRSLAGQFTPKEAILTADSMHLHPRAGSAIHVSVKLDARLPSTTLRNGHGEDDVTL
ncbi:uncharacterized protein N7511_007777 [Penicillium nucicola]|uniref:uncharacterized protein n=1 Tax=Penicillium nucicola TaxID=1850975 RepID=UPI0025452BF7|nr:uncharacterized protein N7511_007777 [Penicillium nucicola]KAJ5753624.1 hypothetical protein N7511_007777 [Penicillium nucicola]